MVNVANTAKKIRQEIADQIGRIESLPEEIDIEDSLIWDGLTEDGVFVADIAICGAFDDSIEGWQNSDDWHWLAEASNELHCMVGESNGTPDLVASGVSFQGIGISFGRATIEQREEMTRALIAVCVIRWGEILAIHGSREALDAAARVMNGEAGDILVEAAINDRSAVNPAYFHQWSMTV